MFAAASKSGRAGSAAPTTDASFAYVPLLTETGSTSSRSTTVADGALTPNTVTRNNLVSTGWTSPYQTDGYWSNQFNGSSTLNLATNAIPASGAFTFETFVYVTGTAASQCIAAQYPNGTASGRFMILWNDTANKFTVVLGASTVFVSDATYSANSWLYLVVQRDASNVWSMYVNGTRNTATVSSATAIDTAVTYIGNRNTGGTPYTGYISNLRVVSSALYSGSTISVPTTPFSVSTTNQVLLTCYSNRFIDANTATTAKVITVTGTPSVQSGYYPFAAPTASPGAALLNGTNQYLSSPASISGPFDITSGNFTLEAWIYPTSFNSLQTTIIGTRGAGANNWELRTTPSLSNAIQFYFTGTGSSVASSAAPTLNAWTHVAVVRSTNAVTMYFNGISVGTATFGNGTPTTTTLLIGLETTGGTDAFPGYIGNLRIVKGTAVYTGAFTPPSGPLTQTGGTYPSTTNVNTSIPAANTSLLLNLADSNYTSASSGGTNNTFIDDSTNAFTITRNGTPTQGSRTPYWPNGQWSNYFAASGDYISVPDAANLELGASDFQMSAWVYLTAYPVSNLGSYASAILAKGNFAGTRSYTFTVDGTSGTTLTVGLTNAGGTTTNITGSFSFALNTWYAVRATRVSNRVYLFVNGTLLNAGGTAYTDTVSNGTDTLKVGRANLDANYLFQLFGYVSNVSLAIGGTGYSTASYTPATTPTTATSDIKFLSCQSNRFKDNSSVPAVVTVTGTPTVQAFQPFSPAASYSAATYAGSGYFNGSTDYLTAASNAAFTLGPSGNNFTIEFWAYANGLQASNAVLLTTWGNLNTDYLNKWILSFAAPASNSTLNWGNSVGSAVVVTTSFPLYSWVHVAVVRNGSTITIYINGTSSVTQTTNQDYSAQGALSAGFVAAGGYFNGYISNIRIVKGVAIYTAAFTPPTTPVTNTAQTSLLLNMANAGIYDAAAQNDITTVGGVQVATTPTPKWPPSSTSFNGSTGYLTAPSNPVFAFGSANFTIEFWLYANAIPTNPLIAQLYDTRPASTNGAYILIYLDNDGAIKLWVNSANRITSSVISTGAWYYVALTRSSGLTKLFLNGTQTGSTYTDSTVYLAGAPFIGASYSAGAAIANFFNGYIQDFRITRGVGRTITASPTAAFPTR